MLTNTRNSCRNLGFSLVEILISLLIVCLAAANISGLQKMIIEQNRDNVAHTEVIELANKKMNEVLSSENIASISALSGAEMISEQPGNTVFDMQWSISGLNNSYDAGENIRNVALDIAWDDSTGDRKNFVYTQQVNLARLLTPEIYEGISEDARILESFIESNEIIYFEDKMGYKKDAFVIYNSELFKATKVHAVGNGNPRDVTDPTLLSEGWQSYGHIDKIDRDFLQDNPDLTTLFLDP
ncbi:MAG: prepilin-type N-terminal cleavage/methylation domain-containing protein [Psychromonas sp.]